MTRLRPARFPALPIPHIISARSGKYSRRWREARDEGAHMIRVILPFHLQTLAQVGSEVKLQVDGPVTQRSILDALEARYPMLRGTIRDHVTKLRRPMLRFYACDEDYSHESPDAPLPEKVASGAEPLWIIG